MLTQANNWGPMLPLFWGLLVLFPLRGSSSLCLDLLLLPRHPGSYLSHCRTTCHKGIYEVCAWIP
ncbi:hypothetical protein L209DRAFT_757645, partial [Thermothelomyces heterothallicus CBS 203.75]